MAEVVVEKVEGERNVYRVKVVDKDDKPCSLEMVSFISTPAEKRLVLNAKCGGRVEWITLQLQ